MSTNTKLALASVASALVCAGCGFGGGTWLYGLGALGGVTFLAQTIAALFGFRIL